MSRKTYYGNYLAHYGVLGMKWGVWNEETRARYGRSTSKSNDVSRMSDQELKKKVNRLNMEKQYNDFVNNDSPQPGEETKKKLKSERDALNSAVDLSKKTSQFGKKKNRKTQTEEDLSQMSDQELREKINRLNMEKQYNDLVNNKNDVKSGKDKVFDILDDIGDLLAIGASAVSLYIAIVSLRQGG